MVSLLLLGAGLLVCFVSFRFFFEYSRQIWQCRSVTGRVVAIHSKEDKQKRGYGQIVDSRVYTVPIVEYSDADERKLRFEGEIEAVPNGLHKGMDVTVFLNKSNPRIARLEQGAFMGYATTGIALISGLLSLGYLAFKLNIQEEFATVTNNPLRTMITLGIPVYILFRLSKLIFGLKEKKRYSENAYYTDEPNPLARGRCQSEFE